MAIEPRRRFRFLKELAEGSFGKVYLAEMVTGDNFSTVVAIKLLHGKWLGHEEIVMRSRDEARLLGLLRHPHIVRVEDLTSINAQCAVIMEYLDGVDLKTLTQFLASRGQRFPYRACFEVTSAIASALHAAYNHEPLQGGAPLRVIHRDIKPSNVMVTAAGEVKVLDFGTAHANFDDREAKTMALAFGSQAYMAPERVIGDPDAPSSDIFSLGITFYEALTLERFGPIHVRESKYRKRLEEIIPVMRFGELPSGLAEEVEAFFRRMLEFDAELRPTAAEVVDTMEEFGERAEDMGLRRFCKAIVPEAIQTHVYDALPGDPLTGTTVYEDASSAFGTLPNTVSEPRQRQVAVPEVSDPFAVPPELDDEPVAGEPGPEHARPRLGGTSTLPGPFGEFMPMEVIEPQVATPTIVGLLPEADALVPEVDAPWAPPEEPEEGSVFAAPEELAAAADEQEPEVEWPSTEEPPVSSPPLTPPAPPTPLVVSDPFKQPSEDVPPLEANASAWTEAPLPPPQSPVDGPEPAREIQPWPPALESASPVDPPPTAQARGPSRLVMVVAGLLGALVVIAGGGFAVYKTMDQGSGPSPDVKPDEGANAEPNSTGRPARPGEGGNLLLLMDPPGAASVSITSLLGFRHEWDGLGKLELNDIPNGAYKTRINPKKGTSIRSTVEVAAGQTCTYKYIVSTAKDEWEKLGCQ